jgi:hypothetical protein
MEGGNLKEIVRDRVYDRRRIIIVSQIPVMKHIKLLGWLWLLLGGAWSLLAVLSLLSRAGTGLGYTMSRSAWWEEVVSDTLEGVIFVMSAVTGLALLRGWPWCRLGVWILGLIWLAFSVFMVSSASGTLAMRLLWFGPSLTISLYSLTVLLFVRYERKLG